jgi:membrane protein
MSAMDGRIARRRVSPWAIAGLIATGYAAHGLLRGGGSGVPLAPSQDDLERRIAAISPERPKSPATLFQIARNVVVRISKDNLTLVAAGVAFYSMSAIFPGIAAFVSIYGLFANPSRTTKQVESVSGLLPAESLKLLTDALSSYASKSHSTLNLALVIALAIALWSAKAGISALMTGLNIANEQAEGRGLIRQQAVALALTVGAILFGAIALGTLAIVPAAINLLPYLDDGARTELGLGRWPVLAILVTLALAVLYRFGAYKPRPKWRWISWGAAIATIMWLIGSALFSFYVSRFASYDVTYGSLAAPVVLLLWFWLSALIVLIGAEIDAELEHSDSGIVRPVEEASA